VEDSVIASEAKQSRAGKSRVDYFRVRSLSYGGHVVAEPVIGPRFAAPSARNDEH